MIKVRHKFSATKLPVEKVRDLIVTCAAAYFGYSISLNTYYWEDVCINERVTND